MPNWTESKEPKFEQEKIEPEVFLADARKYTESGDYYMAERAYVNALSNARGTSNVKNITRIVKVGLSEIYTLWMQDCQKRYEFQDAEPVLQKLLKISDDKRKAKEELIKLYETWGLSLSIYDKNWKGALLVFIKKLKLEKEIGLNTNITESQICSLLFSSDNPSNKKKAMDLNLDKKEVRIRLLISAVLMTVVALLSPIFAPYSIGVYIFSYIILPIRSDWEWDSSSYKEKLRKCLLLTFFSLIWFVFLVIYGSSGSWSEVDRRYMVLSVITLVFIICISVRVLLFAISQFRIYYSYQKQDILDAVKDIFPPVIVSCKSCEAKLKVSGETISAVKCPKCGNIAREAIDLRIKNKPVVDSSKADSEGYDPQYAWGRVGFLAGRAIAKEIIRNLRF